MIFSQCYRSIWQYVACPLYSDEEHASVQVWLWRARISQIFVWRYDYKIFCQRPIPYHLNGIQAPKVDSIDITADPVEHEEFKISRKNSSADGPTYEEKYDYEADDDSNDES